MIFDNMTDRELLHEVDMRIQKDKLLELLAERLDMRLREIEDLNASINNLEGELDDLA
jgi:hypothetical protein